MIMDILKKQVVKNSFINLISRITVTLVSIGFIGYISRILSKEELGVFALLSVFESLLPVIVGLGLIASAIRLIPEVKARGEESKVSDIIKITLFLTNLVALPLILVGIFGRNYLSLVFLKSNKYANIIIWILLTSFFFTSFSWILLIHQSLQSFTQIAILSIITYVLQRLIAIFLLLKGYGIEGIIYGFFIGSMVGVLLGIFTLKKYIFSKYYGYPIGDLIKFSLPYYAQGWARYVFNQGDQTMVALIFVPEILAVYFLAKKIVSLVILVFEALLEPVIPKLAEIKPKGILIFKHNINKIYNIFVISALIVVILMFINNKNIIYFLGGEKFYNDYLVVNILAISFFVYLLFSIYSIEIYLLEKPQELLKINLLVGGINIVSGFTLGFTFSLIGFAIAQSLGFIIGIIIIQNKYKEITPYNIRKDILYMLIVLLGFVLGSILSKNFIPVIDEVSKLSKVIFINFVVLVLIAYALYVMKKKEITI